MHTAFMQYSPISNLEYNHMQMDKIQADDSSEFDDDQASSCGGGGGGRLKLFHDMTEYLVPDMVDVITDMATDTHEKDLMLPTMSKYLHWRPQWSYCPAFEFPTQIFKPDWIDAGLVSTQKMDNADYQDHRIHLPAIVKYLVYEYCFPTRYYVAYIDSTLMERSRENPLKIYYPYQIWDIRPSYDICSDVWVRPPQQIEEEDKERWESYWSNPLKTRVHRVEGFVRELEKLLENRDKFWIFFDGRIVVTFEKYWVDQEYMDTSRLGTEDCERLLRQFKEDPESLNLPPEVRTQFSLESRNKKLTQESP